jgi:hypothetical protein
VGVGAGVLVVLLLPLPEPFPELPGATSLVLRPSSLAGSLLLLQAERRASDVPSMSAATVRRLAKTLRRSDATGVGLLPQSDLLAIALPPKDPTAREVATPDYPRGFWTTNG